MSESWYECQGPTRDYVYKDIMKHFGSELNKSSKINISFKILNLGYLSLIVKEEIDKEYKKYNGFGSFRGYASFCRKSLIEEVMEKIDKNRNEKLIINKIINFIIHHLYKPNGIGFKKIQEEFNSLKDNRNSIKSKKI